MSSFPPFLFFKLIVNCYQNLPHHIGAKHNFLLHQEVVCHSQHLNPTAISRSPNSYCWYFLRGDAIPTLEFCQVFFSVIEYVCVDCQTHKN